MGMSRRETVSSKKSHAVFNRSTGKMSWFCRVCHSNPGHIIFVSMTHPICTKCFVKDKNERKDLVQKLPEVADKAPVRGYRFVDRAFFTKSTVGKAYADSLFSKINLYGANN
jgi:hypothetical protein